MNQYKDLSPTNLAQYHHFHCDLFIHNVYNRFQARNSIPSPSQLAVAHFERGNTWEQDLLIWLENRHLLLTIAGSLLTQESLRENIQLDDRTHFFIAGVHFLPPKEELEKRYRDVGMKPVQFGSALPDLIEIRRFGGKIYWRVIDAKASTSVKTSHHVQIYYYSLCLKYLLNGPEFVHEGNAAIWLPPSKQNIISLRDLKPIDTDLLAPSLDYFLFVKLPGIVYRNRENLNWHYNPLCRPCPYNSSCREVVVKEGRIGSIPNVSLEDAQALRALLNIASLPKPQNTEIPDIEDLHKLIVTPPGLSVASSKSPSLGRKARRVLALPQKGHLAFSPVLEAVRKKEPCVKTERSLSLPRGEDVAVIMSLVQDPTSSSTWAVCHFAISVYSQTLLISNEIIHGTGEDLVPKLAKLIRTIVQASRSSNISTQFYVWSAAEIAVLQAHLIDSALKSISDHEDIKLCIGALAQGASLLQTKFQPTVLSGVLDKFISEKSRSKAELVSCLKRMDLPTHGTIEDLRERIDNDIRSRKQDVVGDSKNAENRRIELGQLPRVAVLKREVERLIALPVPGYWDLPECALVLCPDTPKCPDEEEIFGLMKGGDSEALQEALGDRNENIFASLTRVRELVQASKQNLLVNDGKMLTSNFMDFCYQEQLRKLFFMQQFEVLTKLNELWHARIDGCPDAPILEYVGSGYGSRGDYEHTFHIISGILDTPAPDKTLSMYDKILVPDEPDDTKSNLPIEALFDDLAVSGLLFPLNRGTAMKWNRQHAEVQDSLWVADVRNIVVDGDRTKVTLHAWGRLGNRFTAGTRYRISPRLVDFNTSKILAALFEMDLKCIFEPTLNPAPPRTISDHHNVPLLQLILDPHSFARIPDANQYLDTETQIQRLFRELRSLGNKSAEALILKSSQHKATRRFLSNRLSVIWGPPGTGKTYTIALSLLRLLDVQNRCQEGGRKIVFVTALTNAAIDAFQSKLRRLINCYRDIDGLPIGWISDVKVERVTRGNDHPKPQGSGTYIYMGTIYQLYNLTKRHASLTVDCVIVDEAGQLGLASLALVLRSLSPNGRIVMAGDMEQLAPIISAKYPRLQGRPMFGSILDCVVARPDLEPEDDEVAEALNSQESQESIIQLTENFRLNPDLGEFVSTIYSRPFRPQKRQIHHLATQLQQAKLAFRLPPPLLRRGSRSLIPKNPLLDSIQEFLFSLSQVMLRRPQSYLRPPLSTFNISSASAPPRRQSSQYDSQSQGDELPAEDPLSLPHPISLAMINMDARHFSSLHSRNTANTEGGQEEDVQYEKHIRGEAALAAALVKTFKRCCPGEDIFVATPHRVQREAVKSALKRKGGDDVGVDVELGSSSSGLSSSSSEAVDQLAAGLKSLKMKDTNPTSISKRSQETVAETRFEDGKVTVDTIERLQGSEASFVICLFTLPHTPSSPPDPTFLLERRRLNVAISRAKTLCVLVTSKEVLRPRVGVLTDEGAAKGYKFLRAFEERAWRGDVKVDLDLVQGV